MKYQEVRIVQIIDSLEAGGAERMAVNYANTLSSKVAFSGLVSSRKEGALKKKIDSSVDYLFLNRKKVLDISALLRFRKYLKSNKVQYIQAHSSSFFLAVVVKISMPSVKIIWHDHYGNAEKLKERKFLVLKIGSIFFYRIIAVNQVLEKWAKDNLFCKKVTYLPNFINLDNITKEIFELSGIRGKRIVCLANLRPQKNHFLLLEVAKKIAVNNSDWTFHLVGKDFEDQYSKAIKDTIKAYKLQDTVYLYGSVQNTESVLEQADIVVLTSDSEGLPVSLLEAGFAGKPLVATAVGEIPNILTNDFGYIVPPNDTNAFFEKLLLLIRDKNLREEKGLKFQSYIKTEFDTHLIIEKYLNFIQ